MSLVKTGSPIKVANIDTRGPISSLSIGLIIIFLLFMILLAFAVAYIIYRRKGLKLRMKANVVRLRATKTLTNISRDSLINSASSLDVLETEMNGDLEEPSSLVTIDKFPEYLHVKTSDGTLINEFESLRTDPVKSHDAAKLPQNRNKNRYKVLLPYDETRVKLKKMDNDEFSDYINANYISGYDGTEHNYIATQGPKKSTFYDFWRMLWDENCRLIVMVTNLVENGKCKCDEYWPESTGKFDDIHVRFISSKVQAEYVIRTFQVSRNSAPRLVRHFHFTGWPDHSAPLYTTTLVSMLHEVDKFSSPDYGPTVIHCSAGVGRSGTVILISEMLKMSRKCQEVDFLKYVYRMRQDRVHMVQNFDQYIFAHNALLEALYGAGTCISCDKFLQEFEKLRTASSSSAITPLMQQYQNINKLTTRMAENCHSAIAPQNVGKNRMDHILPLERCRPYLSTSNDGSGYINAVFINGYKKKNAFLLTQMPLPHTIDDFWVCVYDTDAQTVVLLNEFPLNDESCKPYWAKKSWICGRISVEMISEEDEKFFVVRNFMICNTTKAVEKPRHVKQFHLKGWEKDSQIPPSTYVILALMEEVDRWQLQTANRTIICQCFDGCKACGIFCATKFLCDKIKEEQKVDAFLAVRNLRSNRSHCIPSQEQYEFLHQIACDYLEGFQTYANFK